MPYEHDDLGLRIIGYNTPIRFYDPTRTLRAEIYLQPDNTLNVGGLTAGGSGSTSAGGTHGLGDLAIHTGTLANAQGPQFALLDGTRPLTANWDAGDFRITAKTLASDVATGTAPLVVASTTAVSNLNADLLDGYEGAAFPRKAEAAVITAAWDFQATIDAYDILPATTDAYDLGSSTKLWRKGYLSELETVLFALNTVTISGARQVWGHNAGTLGAALSDSADTCDFGQAMTTGDFVEIRGLGAVEYFQVGTQVSGTTYRIGNSGSGARNLDGSGANAWPAGTPYLVLGASGDGRVEVNADGPKLQMLAQGATYAAATEYVRLGNMRNAFGVGANDYWGFGVGDYAGGNYLKYDSNGGFELVSGDSAVKIDTNDYITLYWDNSGMPTVAGYVGVRAAWGAWGSPASYGIGMYGVGDGAVITDDDTVALVSTSMALKLNTATLTFQSGYAGLVSEYATMAPNAGNDGLNVDLKTGQLSASRAHIGGTADPGDNNLIVDGTATIAGKAYIGDTANGKATLGLTINQGAADDEALALKSSDVAHGMTDITETDTYGNFTKSQDTSGGMTITGFKDGDGVAGHALGLNGRLGMAADTAKTTSAYGVVVITARIKSGTGVADVGANGNLVTICNSSTTRFIFDAEGSAHADVEWTTFDDYDDVALLTDLESAMLAQRDPVKAQFVDFLQYNHDALEAAGIVHFDRENPGHAMVNTTKLSMALVGAIRQTNARMDALEARMLTG